MPKILEPIPTEFYAPVGLFSPEDCLQLGALNLGEWIYTPGFSFLVRVSSGPLCRLFWNNGVAEPHSFESGWEEVNGKWRKSRRNYLSYAVTKGGFITVRWKPYYKAYLQEI